MHIFGDKSYTAFHHHLTRPREYHVIKFFLAELEGRRQGVLLLYGVRIKSQEL